jgi:F-type H+-transporting ATPase subunit b
MAAPRSRNACELKNKLDDRSDAGKDIEGVEGKIPQLATLLAAAVAVAFLLVASPASAAQQPDHAPPKSEQPTPSVAAEPAEHAAEEEHHSVWAGLLWPTVNFAILAGALWYFLKDPIANYLRDRHSGIRKDLVEAANLKATATAQLAEIDRKLQALPGEIETLRTRGTEEIAAEEARIATLAATERDRLLEQTRREIDLQLRIAKRELVEHAAELAVQLAGDRIQRQITPADQERIADGYLHQVKGHRGDAAGSGSGRRA